MGSTAVSLVGLLWSLHTHGYMLADLGPGTRYRYRYPVPQYPVPVPGIHIRPVHPEQHVLSHREEDGDFSSKLRRRMLTSRLGCAIAAGAATASRCLQEELRRISKKTK